MAYQHFRPFLTQPSLFYSTVFYLLAVFLFGIATVGSCQANASEEEHPLTSGRLSIYKADNDNLPEDLQNPIDALLLDTQVEFNISGLSARVKVKQLFKNESPDWVEGIYLFPLPEKSAVDHLQMKIGERIIVGEIKPKREAKKIYQQAKISGKKASLVEQQRPNIFSNKVANIAPFETIEVTIEYQQVVSYSQLEGFQIRFPMTITPRYTPSVKLVEKFTQKQLNDVSLPNKPNTVFQFAPLFSEFIDLSNHSSASSKNTQKNSVTIDLMLNAGLPLESISSPSHPLVINQQDEASYRISLDEFNSVADRDFILNWKPPFSAQPRSAAFAEVIDEEQYLSLMVLPPDSQQLNSSTTSTFDASSPNLAREVIFVLDTSGSMAGESIQQAKRALLFGLSTLKTNDRFNIIEFNHTPTPLFRQPVDFNTSNHYQAKQFIEHLNADGGTEMFSAMQMALKAGQVNDNHSIRQVIFLTDGAISNEADLFQLIKDQLGSSRLFTIGIGSAPNEFFMNRAAKFGRGKSVFISDFKQAENKIKQLFETIQYPMLADIKVNWPQNSIVEMWPNKIPDLFYGDPLWLHAKLSNAEHLVNKPSSAISEPLQIEGQLVQALWQTQIEVPKGQSRPGVAQLWAREKIAALMDQSQHGKLADEHKQTIIQTALKHHLVSRFTSLVAVDKTPSRVADNLYQAKVKSMLPKGTAPAKAPKSSVVHYPKTAINHHFSGIWSAVGLILSCFLFYRLQFYRRTIC